MLALLLSAAAVTAQASPVPPPPVTSPRAAPGTTAPTLTNIQDYITSNDYPADALRDGVEGVTRIRVGVDAKGRPTACTIVNSSGSASLDSTSCRLMMARGKFTPARDRRKRAVAGEWTRAIAWRVETVRNPIDLDDFSAKLTYTLTAGLPDGACRAETSRADGPGDLCDRVRLRAALLANDIPEADRASVTQLVITLQSSKDSGVTPVRPMGIPGLVVLDDRYFRLTVDASGKVVRCSGGGESLAAQGGEAPFCAHYRTLQYVADPKSAERNVLFQSQAYARK